MPTLIPYFWLWDEGLFSTLCSTDCILNAAVILKSQSDSHVFFKREKKKKSLTAYVLLKVKGILPGQQSCYYVKVQIWIPLFKSSVGVGCIMPVRLSCLPIQTDGMTKQNIRKLIQNDKEKNLTETNRSFICNFFKSGISSPWLNRIWLAHSTDTTAWVRRRIRTAIGLKALLNFCILSCIFKRRY